jgi:hypothetical protein
MIARAKNTKEQVAVAQKKRKARWSIETILRDAAIVQMVMVAADPKSSHAAACKASALLLRAEAQNQKDEQRKKKRTPKKNIPVVRRGWDEEEAGVSGQESGDNGQEAEVGGQTSASSFQGNQEPRKRKRRRWNIRPEYRDVMVRRWASDGRSSWRTRRQVRR